MGVPLQYLDPANDPQNGQQADLTQNSFGPTLSGMMRGNIGSVQQDAQVPPAPDPSSLPPSNPSSIGSLGMPDSSQLQQPSQGFGGKLKSALQRFAYYGGQAALAESGLPTDFQIQQENNRANLVNAQVAQIKESMQQVPLTGPDGKVQTNAFGQPIMMPKAIAARVMAAQAQAKGRVQEQQLRNEGNLDVANAKLTPQQTLGKQYTDALASGDQEGAQRALGSLQAYSNANKAIQAVTGRIDPVILGYLGPAPDPTKDPVAAKQWAIQAEAIKTRMAVAPRVAGYMALNAGRYSDFYDPETDTYARLTNAQGSAQGMMPANLAFKNMPKVAQFNEMQTASQSLRGAIQNLDVDFTAAQRAKLQMALNAPSTSIMNNELQSFFGTQQLTDAQQNYVIWLKQMNERLLSLRNVAGMGQGAQDLREAIQATLPNVKSADKSYAMKQMDAVDQQIRSLYQGVGGKKQLPAAQGSNTGQTEPTRPANVPIGYVYNANGSKGPGWYKR